MVTIKTASQFFQQLCIRMIYKYEDDIAYDILEAAKTYDDNKLSAFTFFIEEEGIKKEDIIQRFERAYIGTFDTEEEFIEFMKEKNPLIAKAISHKNFVSIAKGFTYNILNHYFGRFTI